MGRNLNATVAYGVALGEDDDKQWPWNDEDHEDFHEDGDFEEWLYEKAGISGLNWDDYPARPIPRVGRKIEEASADLAEYDRKMAEWKKAVAYEEHYAQQKAARDACPFESDFAGTDEYMVEVLILKGTKVAEGYYGAESFSPNDLRVDSGKLLEAKRWAKENGLDWVPEWLVYPSFM